MNIELTEQEKQFLSDFAAKQSEGAEANIGTKTPIHVVERRDQTFAASDDGDEWICEDNEYRCYESFDAMIADLRKSGRDLPDYGAVEFTDERETNDIWIDSEERYCEAFSIHAQRGQIITTYRPVAFFFIRDEAVRYKDGYQRHNCENCRIYTYGLGYSNKGDMPVFRELLMKMGTALNEQAGVLARSASEARSQDGR